MILHIAPILPLLTPLPVLAPILLPRRVANRLGPLAGRLVISLAFLSLALCLLSCIALVFVGTPIHESFLEIAPFGITVYFDVVSSIMLLLVACLAVVVTSYSLNYLHGNPDQGRFFKWLSVTIGSVLLLIVSGNLGLFTASWMAISLSLHQLLTFYGHRQGAMMAARKKYLFSRLGDVCLFVALGIAWKEFGSFDYTKLFAAAAAGTTLPLQVFAFLLVAAAMLKSAQFPFHGWLPDTMETPTPVSALMHAGIINAGGFLIIRFSPLVALSPGALELLAAVGGFTALFASLVMITQTSVKRALGFSTVAQMGFMMLQCGLGAFAIALLHIVAHSLYKAHAFLASGSVIDQCRDAGEPPTRTYLGLRGCLFSFLGAGVLVWMFSPLAGVTHWGDPGEAGLLLILTIAIAQLLWNWWSAAPSPWGTLLGIAAGAGICGVSIALHEATRSLVGHAVAPERFFPLAWPIAILTVLAFLLLALRAFLPPSWVSTPVGQSLFVHAYNGFYANTIANRVLNKIVPIKGDHP